MRKNLFLLGLIGFTSIGNSLSAQEYINKKVTDNRGSVNFVTFKENSSLSSLSIPNLFKEVLNLSPNTELRKSKVVDANVKNLSTEKYQMYYHNIKVEFGTYNLHYKNGKLTSMNGEVFDTKNTDISPKISSKIALQNAIQSVGAEKYMWENDNKNIDNYQKPNGELVLVPIQQADESYKLILAYKFDIFAEKPLSRAYIYVSALNGDIILTDAIIKHATQKKKNILLEEIDLEKINSEIKDSNLKKLTSKLVLGTADTRYSGQRNIETSLNNTGDKYILYDTTRGNGIRTYNLKKGASIGNRVDFTDTDNNWTTAEYDNANYDNAALDAHWGVATTYDYFKEKHNRNSYDDKGSLLNSYVHYGNAIDNAFWSGTYMLYGDGATLFSPLTAFDVTAHELGHGVCAFTAELAYQRESGAMNEGLSDIWGATVENYGAPEKQAFLIGEDIAKTAPGYLRSLSDPKTTLLPDTYKGIFWKQATAAEGCITPDRDANDYCGVHTNSGVLNHWFYILVQGKKGTNDIGKSYDVKGIGFEKAAKIVYLLESSYLSANSNYNNAKDFGIQAAIELYGADSLEAIATQDAFYAVGLGLKYNPNGSDTINPTTPTNLEASNTTNISTYLTWTSSTDNFALDGYNVYRNGNLVGNTLNNYYHDKSLSANTTYSYKIKAKDEAGNLSDFSNEVSIKTLSTGASSYCTSLANDSNNMRIKNVKINNIDNTSIATVGYEDFSYLSTDVERGKTYSISITPDRAGNYPMKYNVYVDYDSSGTFTQTGETVFTQSATLNSPVTGNFTIPATATLGQVRMRVVAGHSTSTINSCNTYTYGQTEDYTLNIVNPLSTTDNLKNNKDITIYPNPIQDVINIQSKASGEFDYFVYNTAGQLILKGKSSDKKINAQTLKTGNYILEIKNNEGAKSVHKFIKQ